MMLIDLFRKGKAQFNITLYLYVYAINVYDHDSYSLIEHIYIYL